jgi:hypothetical protein
MLCCLLVSAVLLGCKAKTADSDATTPVAKTDATPPTDAAKPTDAKTDAVQGDLAGDWTVEGQDGGGTYTFGSDGTFNADLARDQVKTVMNGTYEVKGSDLTLVIKAMSATTTDPKQEEMVKEANKLIQASLNKPAAGTIKWKSKDEVETTLGGQTTALKRK